MANPFYRLQVAALVDAFCALDEMVEELKADKLHPERIHAMALSKHAEELLQKVDTIALPKSARRAGRDVGDFAYLMAELLKPYGELEEDRAKLPTVREVRKYVETKDPDVTVLIDKEAFEKVELYQAKARETIRKPAKDYGQSCEKPLDSISFDSN